MTRDALVRACADLVAEQGLGSLSLRQVAERVGIKAPSIYAHFDSKEALLLEAGRHAASVLGTMMRRHGRGRDARERLLATAMAYLRFAATHRSLFALFFLEQPSTRRSLDEAPPPHSPYGLLLERVADFVGHDKAEVETLAFGVWSLVHGAAVLRQTHLRDFSGPVVEATRLNLKRLLDGWATTAGHPTRSPQGPLEGGLS